MRFGLETALFLILLIAYPVWGHFFTRRLKAGAADPGVRSRGYLETIAALWLTAAAAAAIDGPRALVMAPARAAWLPPAHALMPLVFGVLVGLTLPMVVLRFKRAGVAAKPLAKQLDGLGWFLPITAQQRILWIALSLTAGICEELLFRGFALRYLTASPIALPLAAALLAAAAAFGINHLYQGVAGVAATAAIGVIFALLFVASGNLLLPIVIHALVDLRVLLLPAPALRRSPS